MNMYAGFFSCFIYSCLFMVVLIPNLVYLVMYLFLLIPTFWLYMVATFIYIYIHAYTCIYIHAHKHGVTLNCSSARNTIRLRWKSHRYMFGDENYIIKKTKKLNFPAPYLLLSKRWLTWVVMSKPGECRPVPSSSILNFW